MKPRIVILLLLAIATALGVDAQRLNDKLLNRPYADMRRWHLGFSIGVHTQDLQLTHSGFITSQGGEWQMEVPDFSPGFCVNGLVDYRLGRYLNLRFSPGMWFGNRYVKMLNHTTGERLSQNIKSAYVVLPLDLKFSGMRYRNSRPYVTAGAMGAIDVAKHSSDYLKLSPADIYLTVGFGCDFYLPYFKLNPELKFCFGMSDILVHDRPDLAEEPAKFDITRSLSKAMSRMVVLTFYFE